MFLQSFMKKEQKVVHGGGPDHIYICIMLAFSNVVEGQRVICQLFYVSGRAELKQLHGIASAAT